MTGLERLKAYLTDQRIIFTVHHHRPTFAAQDVAASEHIPGRQVAKVVAVFVDGVLALLVLPACFRVNLAHVSDAIGAHSVYLAGEADLAAAFSDCELGTMSPFGNLYHVPVYVDHALAKVETIVFQAGTHTDSITMAYADFARLVKPCVARFAYHTYDIPEYSW